MTTLVFENLTALPALVRSLRFHLTRLGRWIDSTVSALAARSVPELRMAEVQSEIARYQTRIRR